LVPSVCRGLVWFYIALRTRRS